jgi:hypothetical protein
MAQEGLRPAPPRRVKAKWALHSAPVQCGSRKHQAMPVKPLIISAFVALGAFSAPIDAPRLGQFAQPNLLIQTQDRDIRSLREVVSELRSRYGGDLIDARLEDGARPIYVIRWRMPDGQVRDFRVDASR